MPGPTLSLLCSWLPAATVPMAPSMAAAAEPEPPGNHASTNILAVFRRNPEKNRYVDASWGVFHRVQLGADEAVEVSAGGLADSQEWHRSVGKGLARYDSGGEPETTRGERAVLIQSESHIATLVAEFPDLKDGLEQPGCFGENILAKGNAFDATHVFIGDVFSVQGSTLLLQVTSSRRPCANVDIRHGKKYGSKGVRAFCARTGCAGTFFRVLRDGPLAVRDVPPRDCSVQVLWLFWDLLRCLNMSWGWMGRARAPYWSYSSGSQKGSLWRRSVFN